jgi:uncharacterized protein
MGSAVSQKQRSKIMENDITPTKQLWYRIPLLLIVSLAIARLINEFSFDVADWLYPSLQSFDPESVFLYISIHHIMQWLLALLLILLIVRFSKHSMADFGFNLNEWKTSLRWVPIFSAIWLVIQFGAGYFLVRNGMPANPGYSLNARNVIGTFGFQLFLSGTSEETLFRGLIMTSMFLWWRPLFASDKKAGWAAIIASTVVFMFEHINFTLSPLGISHFNWLQQGTVLIFGLFYGILYQRTRSLLGPVLAHGLLNCIIVASGMVLFLMFGY